MFINLENVIDYDDNTSQEEQSQMLHTTWEEATYISFDEAQQQSRILVGVDTTHNHDRLFT